MDSNKSDEASIDDIKRDLFDLAENLRIELQVKDQELKVKDKKLAKEKQQKKKLSADLELKKEHSRIRENQFRELEIKLISAQGMSTELQMILWKLFPSNSCCYYIQVKVDSGCEHYLAVDTSGQLCIYNRPGLITPNKFKFTKNSNGTFSIYEITEEKYLQTENSSNFSRVHFSANNEESAGEFVLFFHPQNRRCGLSVDISTLDGVFLHMDNENFVAANSSEAPYPKFLLIPVDE